MNPDRPRVNAPLSIQRERLRRRGSVAKRGILLMAAGGAIALGLVLLGRPILAAMAERQRADLEWNDFRREIEQKRDRAKALVDQAATFEPAAALSAARVHEKNGISIRLFDRLDLATLAPLPSDGATTDSRSDTRPGRVTHPQLRQERRPALALASGSVLRFPVDLPERPLRLTFGLGTEERKRKGRVEVRFRFGDREATRGFPLPQKKETWSVEFEDVPGWATGPGSMEWTLKEADHEPVYLSEPVIFSEPQRPLHVVLILEDTLRADHLSSYGYHRRTSPFKERFFREGVVFENAFAQGPTTLISCPTLMTSLYPSATGVVADGDRLPDKALTLAEILRDQGYATGALIQNPYAGRMTGLHQGFDRTEGPKGRRSHPTSREIYTSLAADWIDAAGGRNTFLYLHIIDPHHPYMHDDVFTYDGARLSDRAPDFDDPLAFEGDPDTVARDSAEGKRLQYGGEIRRNDYYFGKFIEQLEARGILDDTLIIFVSDHGEYFGERGMWVHTAPGFRQVTHVPMMMRHPDLISEGRRVKAPVQLIDVMPTLLDYLEIPREPFLLSGDSLAPLIRDASEGSEDWERRLVFSEENEYWGASFIRGPWHVISSSAFMRNWDKFERGSRLRREWRRRWNSGEHVRVYQMTEDPGELRPKLLGRDPAFAEEVRSLRDALRSEYAAVRALLGGSDVEEMEIDPEVIEKLKDLGYL